MSIVLIVLASLLGLAALGSAAGKLRRVPSVVESMHSVGVSDAQMRGLAVLEILGALGLLVGIWLPFIGIAAAACLTIYFLGAVISHLRAKQPFSAAIAPFVLMLLALATTIAELMR